MIRSIQRSLTDLLGEEYISAVCAARAALTGFFELGGGISALRGCAPTRLNFALCAAMIGWGGVSVHMQTAAAVAAANVKTARHLAGRALSAALSAAYALAAYALI